MKDLSDRAKGIISKFNYITIASVTADGLPWNSPVFAAYDNNYNFYWGTHKDSQKAKNLKVNSNVFLVIYDSTVKAGSGEGVYIKAKATKLTNTKEIKIAHKLLSDRHEVPYWKFEEFMGDTPLALFRATPEQVWVNDEGEVNGHYIDIRLKVNL